MTMILLPGSWSAGNPQVKGPELGIVKKGREELINKATALLNSFFSVRSQGDERTSV
jgi:hypothetical protein